MPDGLDVAIIGDEVLAATRAGGPAPRPTVLPEFAAIAGTDPGDAAGYERAGARQQQLGRERRAVGDRQADRRQRSASRGRAAVAALHRPSECAGLECRPGRSEPPFLGVAIGHNERIGWGLTIVGTDQHDVYVEELNPANENEVKFNGGWEPLRIVREEIR